MCGKHHRPLLEEQLACGVEDEQVDRPVSQAKLMHLATWLLVDHLIVGIDDIKYFFALYSV